MAKPDWITLSKTSGTGNDTVTVTAAKNTSTSARSGSITVKSGSLSKVVTISQEGQTQNSLVWPTSGLAFPPIQNYISNNSTHLDVDLKYFDGSLTTLDATIFMVNGEEESSSRVLSDFGLSLTGSIIKTNGDITTVRFQVTVTDSTKLETELDTSHYGSGIETEPYYGDMSFYITGLKGTNGVDVVSEAYALTIYKVVPQSLVGKITLSPETVKIDLEGNDSVTVTYSNIVPSSIQIDTSEISDSITITPQNPPTGQEISSGIFNLFITVSSEAYTDINYEFNVSGRDSEDQIIMATGTIYVRP